VPPAAVRSEATGEAAFLWGVVGTAAATVAGSGAISALGHGEVLTRLMMQLAGLGLVGLGSMMGLLAALWLKAGYWRPRRQGTVDPYQAALDKTCRGSVLLAALLIVCGVWFFRGKDSWWIVTPNVWWALIVGGLLTLAAWELDRELRYARGQLPLQPLRRVLRLCRGFRWWRRRTRRSPNPFDGLPSVLLDSEAPPERQNRTNRYVLLAATGLVFACPLAGGAVAVVDRFDPPPDVPSAVTPPSAPGGSESTVLADPLTPRHGAPSDEPLIPTYEQLCGSFVEPGDGAPEPQRGLIRQLTLSSGLPGGCRQSARAVTNHPDVFVAEGLCATTRVSVIVATPTDAGLLYQEAGDIAMELVARGILQGASNRVDIGEGDAYVLQSDVGPWVLIRETKSAGVAIPDPTALPCAQYTNRAVRYTVLPPPLAAAWIYQVRVSDQWLWPHPDPTYRGAGSAFMFTTTDQSGSSLAEGRCNEAQTRCAFSYAGGREAIWTASSSLAAEDLVALGP
jgi:hypothetical protein